MVVLDNLSKISRSLSDALCRLSTGGGFATRELYSNEDEIIFDVVRPIILTGVGEVADRSDLIDRALRLTLDPIPEGRRITERQMKAGFERDRPHILGALFDATSCALRRRDSITLATSPRMADWAHWATAAEHGLGLADGAMMRAFEADRSSAHDTAVEASPIGPAVLALLGTQGRTWEGSATQLLTALPKPEQSSLYEWPKNPASLSRELRMIARDLRAIGIEVSFEKTGRSRARIIRMQRVAAPADADAGTGNDPASAANPVSEPANADADGADGADDVSANLKLKPSANYWQFGH